MQTMGTTAPLARHGQSRCRAGPAVGHSDKAKDKIARQTGDPPVKRDASPARTSPTGRST